MYLMQDTSRIETGTAKHENQNNSKIKVKRIEQRNLGTKRNRVKQGLTSKDNPPYYRGE